MAGAIRGALTKYKAMLSKKKAARAKWASEAERLGYATATGLKNRWAEVKRQQEIYRSWRKRYVKTMMRKTGMTEKELVEIGAVPPSVSARTSDFSSKEEIAKFLRELKKTRKQWTQRRVDMKKVVDEALLRWKVQRGEAQGTGEMETPSNGGFHGSMTEAQTVLLNRLDGATMLTEDEWNELVNEVSTMSDEEIAEFYNQDNNQIFKWLQSTSPKVLAKHNQEPDIDGDTAMARNAYFLKLIKTVKSQ